MVLGSRVAAAEPLDPWPRVASAYLVVADGELLWARNADAIRPPASLAKLMTALVLLAHDWDPDATIITSRTAAGIEGSRLGLRAGERLRAGDAFTALLVRSANDACVALAEHMAGSLAAFAALMNARAAAMGLQESHFVHPCGLDAPGQGSSARDLLQVAAEAMQLSEVARAVALTDAVVTTLDGRRLFMHTGNHLLGRTRGVEGIKSGYTGKAGKCLIALAHRDGHAVWLVMLNAPERWFTAQGMIDAAFARVADREGRGE
ncbi:D-alanyl-D-alanine carboxypeptidase (penicillin-binding protein 5/6) [Steroidobacter denitrificans]|uniref:D-alanyl-D-alanine carboxypeptidase (Penicillin-binding protein 5/6) n=1 Tax=Steroidobacter denitrificans TaxID=465721 RepID=A0A127F8Q7_STEDE|nr:D-alanyl-D-alanine carboxypeptidase (penicillin-binding protein 5/6) [Steroidobacter denitrificans]